MAVRGAPRDNFFAAVGNSQRWVSADLFLRKRSRDAVEYIAELPKAEHDANEWQAAMQAPLLVVEHDGPTMLARIGVMGAHECLTIALSHTVEKSFFFARRVTLGSPKIRFIVIIVRCGPVVDRRPRWRVGKTRSGV